MSWAWAAWVVGVVAVALDGIRLWHDDDRKRLDWAVFGAICLGALLGPLTIWQSDDQEKRHATEIAKLSEQSRVIQSIGLEMKLVAVRRPGETCPPTYPVRLLLSTSRQATLFRSGETTVTFVATDGGEHRVSPRCGAEYQFTYNPALGAPILGKPINALSNYDRLHFDVGSLMAGADLKEGIAEMTWAVLVNGRRVASGKEQRSVKEIDGEYVYIAVDMVQLEEQFAKAVYEEER